MNTRRTTTRREERGVDNERIPSRGDHVPVVVQEEFHVEVPPYILKDP